MDDERFLGSSNPNPNLRGFGAERPPRPPAPEQRSSAQIMERFRAMIREREEELQSVFGAEDDDDFSLPPPTRGEIVRYYEELLAELTFNSKLVITELTMIADEQRQHADGIADAICARILEVPADQKLPSLYLLDSIVKNVGDEYRRCFAARLPKVFCVAYNQVSSNSHPAMRHLFGTWSQCFPVSVLRKIEDELQFSAPENKRSTGLADGRQSESTSSRPLHGIHVNPKYLDTRHQLDHSAAMRVIDSRSEAQPIDFDGETMESNSLESPKGWSGASPKFHDFERTRGVSSSLQRYMHKSPMQHGDYDLDHTSALPPRAGITRSGSPQTTSVCESYTVGVEGTVPRSKGKGPKHSPSSKVGLRKSISPSLDMIQRDVSPRKGAEKASPSHSGMGLGSARVSGQNDWLERRWPLDDTAQQREGSGRYSLNNGYGKQRELIDAYGDYRGKNISHERHPKVQKLDVDGMSGEAATRNWQSSEEEEYVWEDMSPTLADRNSRSSIQPFRPFTARVGLGRPDDRLLDPGFRRDSWLDQAPQPPVVDPATIVEDRIPVRHFHGSMNGKYLDGNVSQNESSRYYQSSHHFQEPGNYGFPQYPHQGISPKSRGIVHQTPFSTSGVIPSFGHKFPGPFDSYSESDLPFGRLPSIHSDSLNVDSSTMDKHLTHRPYSPCAAPVIWPPPHKSQQLPLVPVPPSQKPFKGPFDFVAGHKRAHNDGPNPSLFLPQQKYDIAERKTTNSSRPLYQAPGLIQVNRQSQKIGSTQVQPLDNHQNFMQTTVAPELVPQHLNHAQTQGHSVDMGSGTPNSLLSVAPSVGMNSVPSTSLHVHGGIVPPLPPGPPPVSSEMGSASQSISSVISNSSANPFSGLIGTLMAQGLISLKPSGQSQDSVGIEFNAELLKVRHESAINALYTDLSRQCTTCGLRFKCQEEHSNHMDWHVTKNRISKNRKQKPSRKWFVSAKEWLSGAETLGNDAVPGFLPKETVSEKKEEKEMAVPADENQYVCALCGEPFEDFYSDETEEWMYKGAVYLNVPSGNVEGLDRSQLGPIVHSKCRSDSADDFGQA